MKRKMNKKGFTIVELVIVIAVIAILAAVLIPTFVSLVKKANLSADTQAVRQMNTVLSAEWAENGAPETKQAVLDVLDNAGYNAKGEEGLVPVTKDHSFYFYMGENVVVLVNNKDNTIVYPEIEADVATCIKNGTFIALKGGNMEASVEAGNIDALGNALLTGNKEIILTDNVTLDVEYTIPAGAEVTLDLGGKELNTEKTSGRSRYINVGKGATLIIENGTFSGRGIQLYDGAKLVINDNVTINTVDDNGGYAIWVNGDAEVVINGGNFNALHGTNGKNDGLDPAIICNEGSGKVTINGGTFKAVSWVYAVIQRGSGEIEINGGTFESSRGVIAADEGKITINGGQFTVNATNPDASSAGVISAGDGNVFVNAGTLISEVNNYCHIYDEGTGSITVKADVVLGEETVSEETVYTNNK